MAKTLHEVRYRIYWLTWVLLLVITLMAISIGSASIAKEAKVLLLMMTMMAKASLIAAYFMHLRFEKLNLIFTVTVGILVTAGILFLFISFDGIRILRLSVHSS